MIDERVDIDIVENEDGIFDEYIGDDGDFGTTNGFNTSIKMSTYCEKRADQSEVADASKRRGWIGNESAEEPGFEIGSKNWLYFQARNTLDTRNALRDSQKDALQWLKKDKHLDNVIVKAFLRSEGVELDIDLIRKSKKIDKHNFKLWEQTGF